MMRDIEGWVHRYFQDVLAYGVTDLRVNCPFCWVRYGREDTNHKLHISLVKEAVHCFRCDYSASWVRLVMDAMDVDYAHALGELYATPSAVSTDELISKFNANAVSKGACEDLVLPDGFEPLVRSLDSSRRASVTLLDHARRYMKQRGFGGSVWRRYNLGVANSIGWRVIIPTEENFWQARAIYDWVKPKYMSPRTEARHILFNSVALKLYGEVVICEGAFSAMAIGSNAIALLRKKATTEQLGRLMESKVERFIVALDSDAKLEGVELARDLVHGGKQVTIWQYEVGDPADGGDFISKNYNLRMEVETILSNPTRQQKLIRRI